MSLGRAFPTQTTTLSLSILLFRADLGKPSAFPTNA
jgi:hypothetical protein